MDYSKRLEEQHKKAELANKLRILNDIKKKSIVSLATTHDGRVFLYFLMNECGFQSSSLILRDDKTINHDAMVVDEALRRLYIGFRKLIPSSLLKEIEFMDIEKVVVDQIEKEKKNGTNR